MKATVLKLLPCNSAAVYLCLFGLLLLVIIFHYGWRLLFAWLLGQEASYICRTPSRFHVAYGVAVVGVVLESSCEAMHECRHLGSNFTKYKADILACAGTCRRVSPKSSISETSWQVDHCLAACTLGKNFEPLRWLTPCQCMAQSINSSCLVIHVKKQAVVGQKV